MSDLSKWYYHLQQNSEETQATCMIDLTSTTRDQSTDRHQQVQVLSSENYLSRTLDINWRIEDELAKDASSRWLIYTQ